MSDRDSSTSKGPMTKRLKIDNNSKTKMKKMVKAMSSKPMKNKIDDAKANFSHLENLPNEILIQKLKNFFHLARCLEESDRLPMIILFGKM